MGNKRQFDIDTLLAFNANEVSFRNLLEPFIPPPEPILVDDTLGELVNLAECKLRKFHLSAQVLPTQEPDQHCLQLRFEGNERLEFTPDIWLCCYPMTRRDLATPLNTQTGSIVEFTPLSCQALTSFFAFEFWTSDRKQKLSSFLLNVPLTGAPANRRQQILRSLLQDKNQVLKLLLFLLAEGKADARELLAAMGISTTSTTVELDDSSNSSSSLSLFPLFEAMVRALDHNPAKLDQVARLVNDLRQLPPEEQLLPDNFEEIW